MILENNEKSFQHRYSESLQKMAERFGAIAEAEAEQIREYLEHSSHLVPERDEDKLVYIVIGFGEGSVIQKLVEISDDSRKVLVIEPWIASFLTLCEERDLSDIIQNPRVEICLCEKPEDVCPVLDRVLLFQNVWHLGLVCMPLPENTKEDEFSIIKTLIQKKVDLTGDVKAFYNMYEARLGLNEIYALANLEKGRLVSRLFSRIPTRSVPVIIVSAGPSLKKNVSLLKKAKGKAIIVAISRALETIREYGCDADFYSVVDADIGFIEKHTKRRIRILMKAQGALDVQKEHASECIYYGFRKEIMDFSFMEDIDYESEDGGRSVATQTLDLFIRAGFGQFILIGQDLAYDKDGKSHAGKLQEWDEKEPVLYVEDVYGNIAPTKREWLEFKSDFEVLARKNPSVRIIDATEAGAKIEGTEIMSFQEALETVCNASFDMEKWFDDLGLMTEQEEHQIRTWFERERDALTGYLDAAYEMSKLAAMVKDGWGHRKDSVYIKLCNRYDDLYHCIMDAKEGELLRYCSSDCLLEYIQNAMQYNNDNAIPEKLEAEKTLAEKFCDRGAKLKKWIEFLLAEVV